MGRVLRISAIVTIALIGGIAGFFVFLIVRFAMEDNTVALSSADNKALSIAILVVVTAILSAVFQLKVLALTEKDDTSTDSDIIDGWAEINRHDDFGILRKLHWTLWSGNFAFAIAIICLSLYILDNYIRFLPLSQFPLGWERYALVLIALMLGILLATDLLVLLRKYILAR